jgi:hypothetical protein
LSGAGQGMKVFTFLPMSRGLNAGGESDSRLVLSLAQSDSTCPIWPVTRVRVPLATAGRGINPLGLEEAISFGILRGGDCAYAEIPRAGA